MHILHVWCSESNASYLFWWKLRDKGLHKQITNNKKTLIFLARPSSNGHTVFRYPSFCGLTAIEDWHRMLLVAHTTAALTEMHFNHLIGLTFVLYSRHWWMSVGSVIFFCLLGGIQWYTSVSYVLSCQMLFYQTATCLLFVLNK